MTNLPIPALRAFYQTWCTAWNQFWFQRRDPTTLGLIRVLTGLIALYSQIVWGRELATFFSDGGILPSDYRSLLFDNYAWSHFDIVKSTAAIWVVHIAGLIAIVLFTIGCLTRITAVLTSLIVISYANRATGALFGLDQILVLLCLYLSVGNSGGALSFDRWWQGRGNHKKQANVSIPGSISQRGDVLTNIATRLIQLHLCLVYFFAGLGKLQGETWWNGQAIWFSVASYEYQTLDLTWLADHMGLVSLLTLVTVFWEVTYPALVWSHLTRPIVLSIAVVTHLGIGVAMGMMPFALVMLVANLSFVEPEWIPRRRGKADR